MKFEQIGADALQRLAELCRRSMVDPPEEEDLGRALFDSMATATVRGDPERGVVVTVVRGEAGYIRLLVVDPGFRGRGLGRALIEAAEEDLSGLPSITVGADAPDYLWPGIDARETAAICLFEAMGYSLSRVQFNMSVDLDRIPHLEGGAERPHSDERDSMKEWLSSHWPNWVDEGLRGFDRGDFLVARDEEGIAGFAAWNVNRRGWFGPTAVRPSLIGKGHGRPLLIGALQEMRSEGLASAEIAWIGPHRFYSRVAGARIGRAFWVMERKRDGDSGSSSGGDN